ncbi:MAG: manganese efflux pump, partial [Lachnospiraceae bacterium]|nr:manganese efflux pump [Lachnospiraceae bacterium]
MSWIFIVNSILLGVGLAMDAFSVSLANGLNEPAMKGGRMSFIAGVFGIFQAAMPLIGWILVHTIATHFHKFEKWIPWIALLLLLYIGGKMILEGVRVKSEDVPVSDLAFGALMVQGVATSIDALSVGFTIADYDAPMAVLAALLIGAVTFIICLAGLMIGKKIGTKIAGKASIFGGILLILIGLEIFIKGMFF